MPIGKDSITKRVAKIEQNEENIAPELVATTAAAPKAPVKKTEDEEVAQLSAFDELPAQPSAPVPSAAQTAEPTADAVEEAPKKDAKAQKPANKNRVGSMFDLLTFSDI